MSTKRPNPQTLNGSITSSSQSSDESEEGARVGSSGRVPRRRPGYRSTSLPRHSSTGNYRRSVTMPNIQSTKSQDDAAVGDNSRRPAVGDSDSRRSEDNKAGGQQRGVILNNQIESQGRAGQGSPQLTSWLQSLADVPEWQGASSRGSKSEILRISRGRLKPEDQASVHQLDNKRKRNSSRENSLESLLEEEDQTSEDCTSRDSLPYLEEEDPENRGGPTFRPQPNQKNSLESLLEDQSGLSASKHKTNSLPKSSFSNIQLRVQEIRDQLEVLKQSSSSSGSKALQQVFPRIRPPNLVSNDSFVDNDNFEEKAKGDPLAVYSTPVNPANPIYNNLNSSLSSRPGFLNNRPLSMPSPPLANSPGNLSPNSLSPRSLSPNGNSPKHNIRPSACYSQPPNPQHQPSSERGVGKRSRESGLPNPFTEFGPSPVSSPSTLSPCSSNSLPSSQAGSQGFFTKSQVVG